MIIEVRDMEDLLRYSNLIPVEMLKDVDKRIGDWLATGGTLEDNYIKQQFRFINNYFKSQGLTTKSMKYKGRCNEQRVDV